MSRRTLTLDRLVLLLLGLALVAVGLLAVDWRGRWVLSGYSDTLRTQQAQDVVGSGWWPWVFALVGVLLGLLGVAWMLGHARRPGPSTLRLSSSDQTGRVEADLRSVAASVAAQLDRTAPVVDPHGTARVVDGISVVQVEARVDAHADATSLIEAVEVAARDVAQAFPDDRVECRVVLNSPGRRPKQRRTGSVRVTG